MYNQELKERFIAEFSDKESRKRVAREFFDAFEEHERAWSADLCTRSAEELQPILNPMIGVRRGSKYVRVNILSAYLKWCVKQGVPGAKDISDQIVVSRDDNMRRGTVANPAHLQWYLDQLLRPESEQTVDAILRCYYWLAYSGVTEEEALRVRVQDVNFATMSINCGNYKEVPIYREAIPAFRCCVEQTQFKFVTTNYNKVSYRDRAPGDLLLRGIKTMSDAAGFRVKMSNKSKAAIAEGKTDLRLSYFKVFLSGLFYRTYELERAGMPIDFKKIAIADLCAVSRIYKTEESITRGYRTMKAREYQLDYECWKRAYT